MFRDSCEIVSAKSGNTVLYLHYSEINSFCVPSRSSLENSFFLKMNDFSQLCQNYIVTTNERYLFITRNMWKTFWSILEAKRNTKYIRKYRLKFIYWHIRLERKIEVQIWWFNSIVMKHININFHNYIFMLFLYFATLIIPITNISNNNKYLIHRLTILFYDLKDMCLT